ncbi:MAG TPA: type VI secretion system-associated FHA domain protein TagH [Steroidobacteraceae bacterium]|nr:type VI secretion system-associated FHA domain protein TagH [Steroidobacteraceae bacterium]
MTLVLQGVALNEEPMSQPLIGRFDERGGTLGRSDQATFTLPDPERMISRVQAHILHSDELYWIENVSAASPILHNGRPLSAGMRVMLRDGDELRVGGYTLRVAFEHDETSATILRGRTVITRRDGTQPIGPPAAMPPPAVTAAASAGVAAGPVTPAAAAAAPRVAAPSPARQSGSAPQGAMSGEAPPARQSGSAPQAPMSGEALWRAFLEGAGIETPLPNAPSPELLTEIGAMMRIAIGGIHRLAAMRAMAKDEMQAQMTVIQVRGNNPLKFAPDGMVALQLLLQPPGRGFLAGPAALRDALVDLQSHQVGVMAGMRAALEAVLDRFDPAKLEAHLTSRSVFDSLRPGHRRARLWEVYLEHYRSLREEAQEDFQRFFGEAFREAYEAQVRSLEAAHEGASPSGPRPGGGTR